MFMNRSVEAPLPDRTGGSNLGSLGRLLSSKELLKIDPLSLGSGQKVHSSFHPEITYDQTKEICQII